MSQEVKRSWPRPFTCKGGSSGPVGWRSPVRTRGDWAGEEGKAGSLHSEAVTCARPRATYTTSAQLAADWTAQHLQSVALHISTWWEILVQMGYRRSLQGGGRRIRHETIQYKEVGEKHISGCDHALGSPLKWQMNEQKSGLALCLRPTTWARAPIFPSSASQFSGKAQGFPGRWTSLVTQMIKNPPAMQNCFWSLGCEDPLEKGMATHSSNLAWRIPWTEKLGGQAIVHGVIKSQSQLSNCLSHFFHFPRKLTSHEWEPIPSPKLSLCVCFPWCGMWTAAGIQVDSGGAWPGETSHQNKAWESHFLLSFTVSSPNPITKTDWGGAGKSFSSKVKY